MSVDANRSVVARKRSRARTEALAERDPRAKLQYFPTPPWATRAFLDAAEIDLRGKLVWEPFCGCGHMAAVLEEAGAHVYASDIYPHGYGAVGSFVGGDLVGDVIRRPWPGRGDWVISNPAFTLMVQAFERGLDVADNVAMFCRLQWLETPERYHLFARHRFEVWVHTDRVPLHEFEWLPDGSTATAYAWFVLRRDRPQWSATAEFDGRFVPPGGRERFTRPDDAYWFAGDPPRILDRRAEGRK